MIVVTTPTGHIGRPLLERLLGRADQPVRVIARDPGKLDPEARRRVEVVQGSHHDPGVVEEAFAGAETVFWLVPPDPVVDDIEAYYLDATRPARDAIERHGVKRVVAVSSMGRGWSDNAGHLSAALAMEELLETGGVDVRALRLPYFLENLLNRVAAIKAQGMFFMPNAADRPLKVIATRDAAAAAADVLLDGSWGGQDGIAVVSDELSPNGMAEIMSDVLGRGVRCQQVPHEGYKQTMLGYGVSDAWAQGLVDMAAAQDAGIYDAEPATVIAGATSFRTWCEQELVPAVEA